MILLVNNSNNIRRLSYITKLRGALESLKIPYYETTGLSNDLMKLKGKVKGIILSGSYLKLTEDILFRTFANDIRCLIEFDVPVLGICFGCQLLTMIFGGKLSNKHNLFCETTEVELDSKSPLFDKLDNIDVQFCFSDLPIASVRDGVKEIAWFKKNGKEHGCAFEFKKDKYYGTLFHPEFHEHSHIILENFIKICKKY